jgi:hypothetical protein
MMFKSLPTKETPMATKKITISGRTYEVSAPYAEGHTITAAEARTLNQTRAENIGNNFRKAIKEAGEDEAKLNELASSLAAYDQQYNFATGGGSVRAIDPLDKEAIRIAKAAIKNTITEKGHKFKDWIAVEGNQEKYDAAVERTSQQDDVLKLARKALADKEKQAKVSVDLG